LRGDLRVVEHINHLSRKLPVWLIYIIGVAPGVYFIMLGIRNELGPEPIAKLEHLLGEFALQMLILGLAITPLRSVLRINLFKFRRAIGLIAFGYVLLHVLTWALLDIGDLNRIWADIMKRPYITIGMLALLGLIPLALTSNNFAQRRLGARWRQLHRLTYGICILGGLHFVMLRKGFQIEPLLYLGSILFLLLARIDIRKWRIFEADRKSKAPMP
jgi:sulfoxide reductase heme-binding subunit YedZ